MSFLAAKWVIINYYVILNMWWGRYTSRDHFLFNPDSERSLLMMPFSQMVMVVRSILTNTFERLQRYSARDWGEKVTNLTGLGLGK